MKEKNRKVTLIKMPHTEVKNSPCIFEIKVPDDKGKPELIGTFEVRGASVTWRDKDHSKKRYQLSMEQLPDVIKKYGKLIK
ncbi:MAG: hypothetical protein K1X91_10515 [Bacteriodetes bacterium]|nr:hypothetical protein [Bacteroidota bacterium]